MTCRGTNKYLPLLAGNELSRKKALKLKAHLERCPGCRKEAEESRRRLTRRKAWPRKKLFGTGRTPNGGKC